MSTKSVSASTSRSTSVATAQAQSQTSSKNNSRDITKSRSIISIRNYLSSKLSIICLSAVMLAVLIMFLWAFHLSMEVVMMVAGAWLAFNIITLAMDYGKSYSFYRKLLDNVAKLDQAYLVLETLDVPNSYDGQVLCEVLYQINKSMNENVKKYRLQSQEFQEYVEMWIHEVKTPLATMSLLAKDPKLNQQIKRIDDYVEQVLYVVRAENAERDYLVKDVSLAEIVGVVANRNREILLANQIDFSVNHLDYQVCTDAKWLEFILNQIISNSIKYQSSKIEISARETAQKIILSICDDGVGINAKDLPRVFDKSFTGNNGRTGKKSTGMGLYIAKTLCEKLGHQISIASEPNQFTKVKITFAKNNYYKNVI